MVYRCVDAACEGEGAAGEQRREEKEDAGEKDTALAVFGPSLHLFKEWRHEVVMATLTAFNV